MVRIYTSNFLLACGATQGSRQRTPRPGVSRRGRRQPTWCRPRMEPPRHLYRIYTLMCTHGRGLPKGLTSYAKPSPYESNPDELGSIRVATATTWSSWRGFSDTRTAILARVNSRTCLEQPSPQSLYRLRVLSDTRHQVLRFLNFRGARERVRSETKF